MIVTIEGTIVESAPLQTIIEVQGIGYEVHTPITTTETLPEPGKKVKLFTHAVYREDSEALYGFHTKGDRDFFRLLVEKVSGVGPKVALSIMSKLSVPLLKNAIANSDTGLLSKCPGIGKKTAERLVIELRDKVIPVGTPMVDFTTEAANPANKNLQCKTLFAEKPDTSFQDAVAALIALGYKPADADKAIRKAKANSPEDNTNTEILIKLALN